MIFNQQPAIMKCVCMICCWLFFLKCFAQNKDSTFRNSQVIKTATVKPEILSSGFIDIVNNGQINASARFIRLSIGEPGKFSFPLSIYSGVSANNFQNQQTFGGQRTNEHLVNSFINPLSGLINFCSESILFFNKKPVLTKAGILYHSGFRILTGYKTGLPPDPFTGRPINFLNSFAAAGIFFQTGAWEKNNSKNVGVFWLTLRYIICKSSGKHLKVIFPLLETNGY